MNMRLAILAAMAFALAAGAARAEKTLKDYSFIRDRKSTRLNSSH